MTPNEWMLGSDTGSSSKTIWAVMMGTRITSVFGASVPLDPSDFGRCHRLLQHFPEWKERLDEVSERYPKWTPMVQKWDEMTALYNRDVETGKSTELYELMQKLRSWSKSNGT